MKEREQMEGKRLMYGLSIKQPTSVFQMKTPVLGHRQRECLSIQSRLHDVGEPCGDMEPEWGGLEHGVSY